MPDLIVKKQNEVYNRIICSDLGISRDLFDYFSFRVPGYQFTPLFKSGYWDGYIRLYNMTSGLLYGGLKDYVDKFTKNRKYTVRWDYDTSDENISLYDVKEWIKEQNFKLEPRDYQIDAFIHAVRSRRIILECPTGSGKSFIIYMLLRWYLKPALIIVPTIGLIHQTFDEFKDEYGFDSDKYIHKIYSGQDKNSDKPIYISTWQSIYKQPKKWFEQFDVIVGDEAHTFKAKSLCSLMEKTESIPYKIGTTGTLDDTQVHELVLTGLFGKVYKVTTTKKLIDEGHLSKFKIKIICLQHTDENRKLVKNLTYAEEMKFLISHEPRNRFISKLALSLEGNTLILFRFIEKHGEILYKMITELDLDRKVYFIHGGVEGEEREKIRKIFEKEEDVIVLASEGTTSTGVNIKRLKNIISASSMKSKIKNLQFIGRSLRKTEHYDEAILFDISDDLSWKKRMNYTLKHLLERIKIYDEQKFKYKLYNVRIS